MCGLTFWQTPIPAIILRRWFTDLRWYNTWFRHTNCSRFIMVTARKFNYKKGIQFGEFDILCIWMPKSNFINLSIHNLCLTNSGICITGMVAMATTWHWLYRKCSTLLHSLIIWATTIFVPNPLVITWHWAIRVTKTENKFEFIVQNETWTLLFAIWFFFQNCTAL